MPGRGARVALALAVAAALGGCAVVGGGDATSSITSADPPSSSAPGGPEAPDTSAAPAWQGREIELHIDGQISVDGGEPLTRGSEVSAALGRADRTTPQTLCDDQALRTTLYQWGDLVVTVLEQQPPGPNVYGWSRGSVIGWDLTPSADGQPGVMPQATGPEGTAIGDDLASVRRAFASDEVGSVETDPSTGQREFGVWYGDAGVGLVLDDDDQVAAMYSGHSCAPR